MKLEYIYKALWCLRALVYGFFWGRFGFPSYIGRPLFISGAARAFIGRKFRAFPGLRLEVFDQGCLIVEEDVALAQNVHITCGNRVVIKKGSCIGAGVCITDIMHSYGDHSANVLKQPNRYKDTIIGENCFIGYGAVLDAGTELGKGCIVGANSYVKGVFPDYSVIAGNPAKVVKSYAP